MYHQKVVGLALLVGGITLVTPMAQEGDREGHDNIRSVVPEKLVPDSPFLGVEEALKTFTLPAGFVIEEVASEPLVDKPVALTFDPQGRLWVCEMRGYMIDSEDSAENESHGRISVLSDTDGDGKMDKRVTFLDNLHFPRAVALVEDGVLYADQEQLRYIQRNDDKPVGEPVVVDANYSFGSTVESKANTLLWGRDNWTYSAGSGIRLKRRKGEWVQEPTKFRGQWGLSQDDLGRLYYNNNSVWLFADELMPNLLIGNPAARLGIRDTVQIGDNRVYPGRVTPGVNRGYIAKANGYDYNELDPKTYKQINATAACGPVIYRGTNFPAEMYGWAFSCDASVNVVKAIKLSENDGRLTGTHPYGNSEFLTSTDERFRPVNLYNSPDGSLFLVDMYHGIIQHKVSLTTYLREQIESRGLEAPAMGHGRIYRIRHVDHELQQAPDLSRADTATLVECLGHRNSWERETAQRLLVEQKSGETAALVRKWLASDNKPARIHALWVLEGVGELTSTDVLPLLESDDDDLARTAAYAALSLPEAGRASLLAATAQLAERSGVVPYQARLLAAMATPQADAALSDLLGRRGKTAFVREAAITGLGERAEEYIQAHPYADKDFQQWVENTRQGVPKLADPASYLYPYHLGVYNQGKSLFEGMAGCVGCHGGDGMGLPGLGPRLDGSDWVTGDEERLIKVVLHGLAGPITIGGERFEPLTIMPGIGQNKELTDEKVAAILTYIRSAWTNRAEMVRKPSVTKVREETAGRGDKVYSEKDFE